MTPRRPWRRSARSISPSTGLARPSTSVRDTKHWRQPTTGANCSISTCRSAAGSAWPDYRDEVGATLAASPTDAVLFALHTLKDAAFAHSVGLDDNRTWSEVVKAYEKVDPLAVLPVLTRLVEHELTVAGAQLYRIAARRLAKIRKIAAGSDKSTDIADFIADLRETHRRRPRLQQEFDRAGLP